MLEEEEGDRQFAEKVTWKRFRDRIMLREKFARQQNHLLSPNEGEVIEERDKSIFYRMAVSFLKLEPRDSRDQIVLGMDNRSDFR